MNWLTSFIARVGVSPEWIATNAHFWFAAFVVLANPHATLAVAGVLVVAAIKEFWFDATYEVPKQTWKDNTLDFLGYAAGAALGWSLAG